MPSDTDDDLLVRWVEGNRDAGDKLLARYYDPVRRFFTNAVDDDLRQDLTNETFRKLIGFKARFKGDASFRTFLFKIARNTLNDHLRSRYRRDAHGFDPLTHSVEDVEGATPSRAVFELERYRHLIGLLRALPVDAKQMLELFYWQDWGAKELGAVFGVDPTTVRTRLHGIRKRLRDALANGEPSDTTTQTDEELEQDLRLVGKLLVGGPGNV